MIPILSSVSGTVIEVLVTVGATVGPDDEVALIESMKMEIPVAADAAGVIEEIRIVAGDLVTEGQVIATLG
ncbi:MAG: acetyl-CoA carboxylase biotin carboxyl carrier protein subunit [Burkholderiaceae bacterium]|jgi:acetyl-CoA carboxylase biotin carboxyl carrier protein